VWKRQGRDVPEGEGWRCRPCRRNRLRRGWLGSEGLGAMQAGGEVSCMYHTIGMPDGSHKLHHWGEIRVIRSELKGAVEEATLAESQGT
jgi:hypothetical protein